MTNNPWDTSKLPIYGCLTGTSLSTDIANVLPGIILKRIYVDTFGTVMMGFTPPPTPKAHHPAPWAAVRGGFIFEARIQIEIFDTDSCSNLPAPTAMWLIACLLRLRIRTPIRLAVIGPVSFEKSETEQQNMQAVVFENAQQQFGCFNAKSFEISDNELAWLRDMLPVAIRLYDDERFFRALSIYDQAQWTPTLEMGVALIWTAIEIFFDLTDTREKAKAISKTLSDYLETDRSARDRTYQKIKDLYYERGRSVHAGRSVATDDAFHCYRFAAMAFQKALIEGQLP